MTTGRGVVKRKPCIKTSEYPTNPEGVTDYRQGWSEAEPLYKDELFPTHITDLRFPSHAEVTPKS